MLHIPALIALGRSAKDVPRGVDPGRLGTEGCLRVHDVRQHLVLDLDEVERVSRGAEVLRNDDGDLISGVP